MKPCKLVDVTIEEDVIICVALEDSSFASRCQLVDAISIVAAQECKVSACLLMGTVGCCESPSPRALVAGSPIGLIEAAQLAWQELRPYIIEDKEVAAA